MQKRRTYIWISKDPVKLLEMLYLRRAGYSFNFLEQRYGADRKTLSYQCRKYMVFPIKKVYSVPNAKSKEIFNPSRIATDVLAEVAPEKVSNWVIVDGERINTGKSYADYLKAYRR